ncbi:hypothetical protein GW17_00011083 [Ensete ventricosum]|nr:hypothetical protein GW17_00011083 [Ensete ventricosum]
MEACNRFADGSMQDFLPITNRSSALNHRPPPPSRVHLCPHRPLLPHQRRSLCPRPGRPHPWKSAPTSASIARFFLTGEAPRAPHLWQSAAHIFAERPLLLTSEGPSAPAPSAPQTTTTCRRPAKPSSSPAKVRPHHDPSLVSDVSILQANTFTYEAAKVLGREENLSSFFTAGSKIVPQLYMPFLMEQWIAQISYIEPRGILFSYYRDGNQTYNLFSNVSHTSDYFVAYSWCTQALDGETGKPYGKIVCLQPGQSNDSKDASNGKKGEASWGVGWGNAKEQMLFFTAPVAKSGILSLGVPIRSLRDSTSRINLQGGCFYLAVEGHIIAQNGPPHTHFVYNNSTMSVLVMDENDTNVLKEYDSFACHGSTFIRPSNTNYLWVSGKRYQLDCFLLNVSGVQLKTKIAIVLLVLFMILGTILGSYVMLQLLQRAQLHETFLRADLIKQKGIIQQAERKSMNKSLAFASASHDIRTSLAGITGLIEICRSDTPQNSELYRNLEQMNSCILNSVLDISKIEAGKMQLEEVEFDIAQVLEESVDIFHVVALKKGLEVIWDPCDCSILVSSNVKGDCRRLKQIIDNLLGNAVKFTSEGHVVLRAWAKKPSLENLRHSSRSFCNSRNAFSLPLLRWISKDKRDQSLVQNDDSLIEIVIEVDDTGASYGWRNQNSR